MPRERSASKGQETTGELALIERIRRRAAGSGRGAVRLGIGDDCAILRPPVGHEIVVTTDMSLEGRHFRTEWHTPESVGHRVLARGLSDLAAMGARPLAAFLSLALPKERAAGGWVDGFLDGLLQLADREGVPLAGGDTSEAPAGLIFSDIVLLGSVKDGRALRRSGARVGDRIYVTGALGGAAAELAILAEKGAIYARKCTKLHEIGSNWGAFAHLYPEPRLAVGQALVRRGLATACIDVSDGLSTDLMHLCEASGAGAEVFAERLPVHRLAQAMGAERGLDAALNGGEDYELLFTARAGAKVPRTIAGVAVTCIGEMRRVRRGETQMTLVGVDGVRRELKAGGWEHLR